MAKLSCLRTAVLAIAVQIVCVLPAWGQTQDVQWRHDYESARAEAQKKGLPLLIEFTTDNCYWCERMAQGAFRDPTIVQMLNSQFIPLKLHSRDSQDLISKLKITAFPTLIFAGPDQAIYEIRKGALDTPKLYTKLQNCHRAAMMARRQADPRQIANRQPTPPKGDTRPGKKELLEIANQRSPKEKIQKLRVPEEEPMPQIPPVGSTTNSNKIQLVKASGTKVRYGVDVGTSRKSMASRLLALAKEEFDTRQYLSCLNRCKVIEATFPDLAEAKTAGQLAESIKKDPERMLEMAAKLQDNLGDIYYSLGKAHLKAEKFTEARVAFEHVIRACPGTPHALKAKMALSTLDQHGPSNSSSNQRGTRSSPETGTRPPAMSTTDSPLLPAPPPPPPSNAKRF